MADLENKVKEAAEQAKDLTRAAVDDVKGEAELLKTDAKGYAQNALEDVKNEGKEVVEELKAAVKRETLDTASTEGAAGYREKEGAAPNGIAIASVVFGVLAVVLSGWLFKVLLGLVSVVLGAKARKEKQTTLATLGFILGAVGVVLGVVSFLF
ncbi:MAG: hypothetical protein IKG47_05520 [Oscillospiraceae bacterium]|nr:hypothetical protein [Oscillospiraceae bacterium]